MHTLFDFITHIKTVEYLVALTAIAGFVLFWEVLKHRPFRSLKEAVREDVGELRRRGRSKLLADVAKIAAAPFIGLFYVVSLPFVFLAALGATAVGAVARLAGGSASMGWRPVEAYFDGKARKRGKAPRDETDA